MDEKPHFRSLVKALVKLKEHSAYLDGLPKQICDEGICKILEAKTLDEMGCFALTFCAKFYMYCEDCKHELNHSNINTVYKLCREIAILTVCKN